MKVRIRHDTGEPAPGLRVICRALASRIPPAEAMTEADGTARLTGVAEGVVIVEWHSNDSGFFAGSRTFSRAQDADVVLERTFRLGGIVCAEDGSPIHHRLTVHAEPADDRPRHPPPPGTATRVRPGAGGRFDLTVTSGRWWICVQREFEADDVAAVRLGPYDAGSTDLRVVLPGWPRIDARVDVPAGAARCGWMWFERDGLAGVTPHVSPAGDGTFRSPRLVQDATYDVVARGDYPANGTLWAIARGVKPGTAGLVLDARPSRTIRARIVHAKGDIITEAIEVRAALRPDVPAGPFDITLTPSLGEYEHRQAPWFAVRMVAGGPGTPLWTPDPPVAAEGDERVVTIVVEPTVTVSGRLVTEDGAPVGGGWIGGAPEWARVAADGTFTYGGCIPNREVALAWKADGSTTAAPLPLGSVKAPASDVTLTLRLP